MVVKAQNSGDLQTIMSKDSLHIGGGERMQFEEISKKIMSWENSHNDGGMKAWNLTHLQNISIVG